MIGATTPPVDDRQAADRIYGELACVIERGLPTLSRSSSDRPHLERALKALCSRAPAGPRLDQLGTIPAISELDAARRRKHHREAAR